MEKESKYVEFSTANNKYIYDAVSGEVIPSGKWIGYIIDNFYLLSKEELIEKCHVSYSEQEKFENEYNYIKNLIEENMFYFPETKENKYELSEYIYNANSSQLILVLTGKCNMRCEYCVYCEKYPQEIGYSEEEMTFETARKGIDLFFELHKEKVAHGYKKQPMINFYGGEPLLRFDLIKEVVEYVEQKDLNSRFYITTNGLLLNEEVADFISRHKFTVTFSLDGFKENHDRNRVTTGGKPTFDIVVSKIKMLQKIKRDRKIVQPISFNCCFDNYTDLEKCIDFFEEHYYEFFPFFTMYNQINPYDTSYYIWTKERVENGELSLDENAFNKSYTKIRKNVFEGKERGHARELTMNLFTSALMLYLRNKWSENIFNNACIPLSKLAVYPAGELCLCEKMNKKLIIGSVFKGIDYEKLEEITRLLTDNFIKGPCATCEAKRICPACFMYMSQKGEFNKGYCERQKQTLKERLGELYQMLEDNPDFIKTMQISKEFVDVLEVNN